MLWRPNVDEKIVSHVVRHSFDMTISHMAVSQPEATNFFK